MVVGRDDEGLSTDIIIGILTVSEAEFVLYNAKVDSTALALLLWTGVSVEVSSSTGKEGEV
jgi:hypothetical protein